MFKTIVKRIYLQLTHGMYNVLMHVFSTVELIFTCVQKLNRCMIEGHSFLVYAFVQKVAVNVYVI